MSVRSNPPQLNTIFPKPPPVPPPPSEKYYAATPVLKNGGTTTLTSGNSQPTTPSANGYSDFDSSTLPLDDDRFGDGVFAPEFPRDKLVIIEKLGSGVFGELHLCETKGLR